MKPAHQPHKPSRLGLFLMNIPAFHALPPMRAAKALTLKEHTLIAPRLPKALDGLTIAYASDIHYGALLDGVRMYDLAKRLNALQADLIILGGDYGEDAQTALKFWKNVPDLQARYGVFASLGNHDRAQSDAPPLKKAIRKRGATPLVNSAAILSINGCRLAVCATDDYNHGFPDFKKTANAVQRADYVIYAPHSPDALKDAYALSQKPFFDLALCGHTHGGQIRFFGFAPKVNSRHGFGYGTRYLSGEISENGVQIIISNGVGTTQLPLRLSTPAQYHLITLKAQK